MKKEWDELAAVLSGGACRAGTEVFRPITLHAERIAIRYRLTGMETAEVADFVRDRLESWNAPTNGSINPTPGEALSRWCFVVADKRAKSLLRSKRRKTTGSYEEAVENGASLPSSDPHEFNTTVLTVRAFIEWLASAKGRDDELVLVKHRLEAIKGNTGTPLRWDSKRKKAVQQRLRSLWRTFEDGSPMPRAKPRRQRTQTTE